MRPWPAVSRRCSNSSVNVVSAALSQPYYLDVTHPKANKGEVVSALSALLAIPTAQIATIGDMPNDVLHVPAERGEHRHG